MHPPAPTGGGGGGVKHSTQDGHAIAAQSSIQTTLLLLSPHGPPPSGSGPAQTIGLNGMTPQRPPRRRAQSVGNSSYGSSPALSSHTPRGSLFTAVSTGRRVGLLRVCWSVRDGLIVPDRGHFHKRR
uniref:Uncharacterized protein n=1 Tax=Anopheles melas TaxID=34690 RepID=A0A182TT20_9DIPT